MERIARAFNFSDGNRMAVAFDDSPVSRCSAKPSVINMAQDVPVSSDPPFFFPCAFAYSLSHNLRIAAHTTMYANAARLNISTRKRAATSAQWRSTDRQSVAFVEKSKAGFLPICLRKRKW